MLPIDREAVVQRLHELRARASETIGRVRGAVLRNDRRGWPRRRLEQALDLVLAASHDFKSPLAGMYGWARTLRSKWDQLDEAQRNELLDRLSHELASLSRMLDNVLATARLGVEPARESVDLSDAVAAAVREAEMLRPDRRIVVSTLNAPVHVVADRARLGRILANLIDNAVKYSPRDASVKVRVLGSSLEGPSSSRIRGSGCRRTRRAVSSMPSPGRREHGPDPRGSVWGCSSPLRSSETSAAPSRSTRRRDEGRRSYSACLSRKRPT